MILGFDPRGMSNSYKNLGVAMYVASPEEKHEVFSNLRNL